MWVPNSCSSLWIRVSWHFSEQITCPGGHIDWQIKQKISMRSVNSKSFSGECCWPWSKGEETREQEPAWPKHDIPPATIPRYPGSHVSIRPLALPIIEWSISPIKSYERALVYATTRTSTMASFWQASLLQALPSLLPLQAFPLSPLRTFSKPLTIEWGASPLKGCARACAYA